MMPSDLDDYMYRNPKPSQVEKTLLPKRDIKSLSKSQKMRVIDEETLQLVDVEFLIKQET